MNNLKNYTEYNKKGLILENIKLNENSIAFNVSVGRLNYGFQEACYGSADALGLDIDIRRMGGVLSVDYRVKLTGDQDKIDRFIRWIKSIEK